MSKAGYIAISRELFDHTDFAPEPFTEREAWIWLIASAAWKPMRVRVGRQAFDLKRGECVFAGRFLAQRWRWSEARVRRFLNKAKTDARVYTLPTREATHITICNYEKYQAPRRTDDAQSDAQTGEPATHPRRKEEPLNHLTSNQREDNAANAATTTDREIESHPAIVFEAGAIRVNARDLKKWQDAFSHLDVKAELLALQDWAGKQANWFMAVQGALAKRNREALISIERASTLPPLPKGMIDARTSGIC
jgi:hypothetical protein